MKIIVEKIILVSAFLVAGIQIANAKYISKGKISEIRVDDNGGPVEILRESSPDSEECSDATKFFIGGVHEDVMPMLAMILTAYQSDREITFITNSCGGEGYTNRVMEVILK